MKKLVVDFDNTLFPTTKYYPIPGKPKLIHKLVAQYVRYKKKQGWVIILNTMREYGRGLEIAIETCSMFNIPIDIVNDNLQSDTEKWGYSRKIGATLTIDDTNIGFIGWALRTFSK